MMNVSVHGPFRNIKSLTNISTATPLAQKIQNVKFAVGESVFTTPLCTDS